MPEKREVLIRMGDENLTFPVVIGTEGEQAIDVRTLRAKTGYITYDEAYANTGSCISKITFIDGEKGILRYRGYPIEQLAERSHFLEVAYLVIYGELPLLGELDLFSSRIMSGGAVPETMRYIFEGFPSHSQPMAIVSALLNALGCFYPEMATNERSHDLELFDQASAILISKVRTIAALTYRMKQRWPFIYPKPNLSYAGNFLHMMFSQPYDDYVVHPDVAQALDLIFLLHADHEQNCSTSTGRMVASGGANLFATLSSCICALWGPLHGGANVAVMDMLEAIYQSGDDGSRFIEAAKDKDHQAKIMGFGHRVYKNYDPRAKILKEAANRVFKILGTRDPLLDIALKLEETALKDAYFIERNLYPNVDFYSGIILRALGIPKDMFTVIFSIGRLPGWIANWKEVAENPNGRIYRPRQVYMGKTMREYVSMEGRRESD